MTLAVAVFAASMGVGMVAPVLPVRADELGASGAEVALTFSAFALTQLFVSPFAGRIADRYGRKPFILIGVGTYLVAALGWWQTESVQVMIGLRALTGIGSGLVFSLAFAYIGDLAPAGREGRYMGMFGVFDFLGFGVGPLVSGVLRDAAGFDAVFLSMAGLMTLSGAAVAIFLPRSSTPRSDEEEAGPRRLVPWRELLADRGLQSLFAMRVGFSFAFGSAFSFLALYLQEEIGATATMVGFVLAGQSLLGGGLQPLLGLVADRANRRLLVVVGAVAIAVAYMTLALSTAYLAILGAFVVLGGIGSATMGVSLLAIQVDVGRRLGMATTMSFGSTGFAVGVLIGSLGGGLIVDRAGTSTTFAVAAGAIVLGAAVFTLRSAGAVAVAGGRPIARASLPAPDRLGASAGAARAADPPKEAGE